MAHRARPLSKALNAIESLGNRLPYPTLLFVYLCGVVLALSALCAWLGVSATHPVSGETVTATNLISVHGLHRILTETVDNFTGFAPVGTVLVAIMGIGVAEHAGLIGVALKATVLKAPARLLTFLVVLAGVLSSLAADSGYVVLIPLAGILFHSAGRHPIAGIAAAFAGVSGGYSANLLIGPLDALLAGLSTEAAALVRPDYNVNAAGNYYFIAVSTFVVALAGTAVTEKLVLPRLGTFDKSEREAQTIEPRDLAALRWVGLFSLGFVGLLVWGLVPDDGVLRQAGTGSVLKSPFINGIVTVIAVYAALAGALFGKLSGRFDSARDTIKGMEASMETMATYLVLMFFAAQFVSYFAWSDLGIILAIKGAGLIRALEPGAGLLLVSFVLLSAFINLMIGSASAKWALLAPVFVPMLLLAGISPEATQMAYRIGDSTTNIITPLMPYFGVVVAFGQRYDRSLGVGTIIATMLPYTLAFLAVWTLLLGGWIALDLPLGPGAPIFVNSHAS